MKAFLLHAAPILDLDWKDSDTFATCSSDMAIHVCSVSTETTHPVKTFLGHTDEVNAVTWSPGGIFLASCSDDSTGGYHAPSHHRTISPSHLLPLFV